MEITRPSYSDLRVAKELQWRSFALSALTRRQHFLRFNCDLCVRSLNYRRVIGENTTLLWRSYCSLIRKRGDVVCFEHAQSQRNRLAFYAISACLFAISLRYCGDLWYRTVFCIFLERIEKAVLALQTLNGHRLHFRIFLITRPLDHQYSQLENSPRFP